MDRRHAVQIAALSLILVVATFIGTQVPIPQTTPDVQQAAYKEINLEDLGDPITFSAPTTSQYDYSYDAKKFGRCPKFEVRRYHDESRGVALNLLSGSTARVGMINLRTNERVETVLNGDTAVLLIGWDDWQTVRLFTDRGVCSQDYEANGPVYSDKNPHNADSALAVDIVDGMELDVHRQYQQGCPVDRFEEDMQVAVGTVDGGLFEYFIGGGFKEYGTNYGWAFDFESKQGGHCFFSTYGAGFGPFFSTFDTSSTGIDDIVAFSKVTSE